MKFCGRCGAALGVVCPDCGFANPDDFRFCGMCGRRLGEVATSPAQLRLPLEPIPAPAVGEPVAPSLRPAPQRPETIPALAGERRIATSLLADVYRSTDLMEQLGTEAWVQLMNRVLRLLAAEVDRFGGRVDQFRGDGLVAFFGATDAHEDDPERAVLAGLAMHAAIRACAEELQAHSQADLKLRVGINTGEVIVASVGEAGVHREDTAMGEGVALAARMEAAAAPGTVLVSEHTYHLIANRFEWQPLGEIHVKGIGRPIAVYRPLRAHRVSGAPPAHDLALPFTGRETAFTTLKARIEALCSGRGGIVLLIGEKGMGKSLLIHRLRQHAAQLIPLCRDETPRPATALTPAALTWLAVTCRSYDQATPYALWGDLLRSWLESFAGDERDLTVLLRQQTDALWGAEAAHYRPYLALLLALPAEGPVAERIAHLKGDTLQRQLAQTLYAWIAALARQGPLVLAFNDLQWADASSLEALQHCLPVCDIAPVLWLASFRPDRSAPVWDFRHRVETEFPHRLTMVDLPPLTRDESRALVEEMLGQSELPELALALIIEKAAGNPYYLREIVYALIDQGLLRRDADGIWRPTQPIHSFDLPGSLRSLFLARVDRLSADERHVLQIAAVIGPLFWRKVLEACVGDPALTAACLTGLQRAQIIHEHGLTPELGMEYTFTPSLARDLIYESLLSSQRAAYHRLVAQEIESVLEPEAIKPYHGLLAYHYRQAGDPNRELYHALAAAAEARRVYANADAAAHYTRALVLLDQLAAQAESATQLRTIYELRFEALDGRRQALIPMGNVEAGVADARALLALAREMADDPLFLADALLAQPEVNSPTSRAELDEGLAMAQQALALARQADDRRREMTALVTLGQLHHLRKDPAWRELADQALALTRQLGDLRMEIGLLLGIGSAYGMDDLQKSTEYLQAALTISQRLEDKETEASLLAALGPQYERAGDYYRQLSEFEQKRVRLYRETGNRLGEGHAMMFCGQITALYLGDYEAGLALMQEALALWSELPDRLFPLLRIAQIQAALGRYEEGWATLAEAAAVGERVILDIGRAGLRLVEAILHNAQGGVAHWRQVLAVQAEIAQMVATDQLSRQYQMAAACEAAAAHLGLARSLEDPNECEAHRLAALAASQTALEIYEQFGFTQVIECLGEEILYRHSLALAANQRAAEARAFLERAYAEMMRKHDLIPPESPYRPTFLENIALHRQIRADYEAAQANSG